MVSDCYLININFSCAVDNTILPDLIYSTDLTQAYVETWAFRFSDSSLLNFMCMIETCRKTSGECTGLTVKNFENQFVSKVKNQITVFITYT